MAVRTCTFIVCLLVLCGAVASDEVCPYTEKELKAMKKGGLDDPKDLNEFLRGCACIYGVLDRSQEVKESRVVTDANGRCQYKQCDVDPSGHSCPQYDCCEETGLCGSSDCAVLGGPTKDGISCDCKSCECVECIWTKDSCFQNQTWHKDDSGKYNEKGGYTCWGEVQCKGYWNGHAYIIPKTCQDNRVGSFCIEDNVHFENLVTNADGINDGWLQATRNPNVTAWKTNFKTCGLFPCTQDDDCCGNQFCDYNQPPFKCPTCPAPEYPGTCQDRETPLSGCCDPKYITTECKDEIQNNYVGWTVVDVTNCDSTDGSFENVVNEYKCTKSPDCNTWVCEVAPEDAAAVAKIKSTLGQHPGSATCDDKVDAPAGKTQIRP